ncbi:uncharacterized protein [Clytia hemisphaerica]|uniref:uncharacterized protein n=1 Tax=Clytia hemisphaerica TaxID=252671 RepID=UPI0034D3C64E
MATKRTLRSLTSNLKNIEGDINGILDENEKLDTERINELTGLMNMMLDKTNRFVQACEEVGETIESDANHMSSNCSKKWKCFKCGGKHNNAICTFKKKDESKNDSQSPAPTPPATTQKTEPDTTTSNLTSAKFQTVLLQTAVAKIKNGKNSENLRLLFDSGSQQTYISPEAKKLLKLEPIDKKTVSIKSFGNGKSEKDLELVEFEVISKTNEKVLVKALVSDICLPIENQPIEVAVKSYSHLQGIELADSNLYNSPLKIDILIGCKDYWRFVGSNQIKGTSGPVAVETNLGFILSGPVDENSGSSKTSVFSTHTMKCATSLSPDEQIRESYAKCFETNPKSDPNVQEILDEFESDTVFKDGHYEIKLPFKEEITNLGDNYARSKIRLKNMVQKQFKDNLEFLRTYDEILQQQLSAGVIEKVEHYEIGQTHYLPHRPVVREDKQSTKVRIVFDASCKSYKGGESLNDTLNPGPSITELLGDVLLRFRSYNYAFTADIEKAFLQIGVTPENRDFVRFIWFENPHSIDYENFEENKLCEYRFARVLFGLNASPFLLQATLNKHITNCTDSLENKEKLKNSLHVDDMTSGANTIEEAVDFYMSSKRNLHDGGFNLRKFKASNRELENIVYDLFPEDKEFSSEQKVLGLNWDRNNDTVYFNFRELREKFVAMPTKRAILHNMASIYDPLGLISPLFVSFKTLFQDICEEKFDWDDILPDRLTERWEKILLEFNKIDKIEIDRPYCIESLHDNIKTVGAHIFSDASKYMFGAAVYLRFVLESGSVKTALVSSKNRIISAKNLKSKHNTTPRNELNGILLATSHGPAVIEALKNSYNISETFYWTDSSIACAWVQNEKKNEDSYVEDRVKKIKTVIKKPLSHLKLVPSEINPSDILTKVHYPLGLARNELWFYGPQFLTEKENAWPDLKPGFSFKTNTTSVTATPASTDLSAAKINISEIIDYKKFNDFSKTSRVLAWAIHFVSKITLKKEEEDTIETKQINNKTKQIIHNNKDCGGVLSIVELELARNLLIEDSQRGLENGKNFTNLKKQLDLFQDENGLWRCGGRLKNSELTYEQKHPLLIDRKHPIAKMIIRESHANVMHNGVSQTLTNLRKRYWITKPRNLIKTVIKECTTCRKHEGKPYGYPNEPSLPRERVTANYAYENMGIDYLGPVYVKDIYAKNNETHKAWIALTTCTTTRAVYLDLVSDCSGPTCVNLLKRLISTHGTPKVMISDNGTNFISTDVQNFMANRGTLWKFNIAKVPWYGGFFERLVRSVKRCLRKSIENAKLNYEEMLTILKEVENILNNRPLTYLYTEENVDPLTPNKLIYGRDLNTNIAPNLNEEENENVDLDTRYVYLQTILDQFWDRWSNEYLVSLRERSRNIAKTSNIDVVPRTDDVVLIHDDKVKRQNWKLGKITKLIRSTDGKVRACELSVITNGKLMNYKRPVNKLYPFEYSRKNEETDEKVTIKFVDEKDTLTFVAVAGVSEKKV